MLMQDDHVSYIMLSFLSRLSFFLGVSVDRVVELKNDGGAKC